MRRSAETALLYMPLVLSVLLAKISVPPLGGMGLGITLPLILLGTLLGIGIGAFRIDLNRLLLYLLLAAWACGTQLFGKTFSLPSLCLLLAIFFPYVLRLKSAEVQADRAMKVQTSFGNLGFALALLGIIQYGAQYALGPELAFPVEHLVPAGFLIEHFNYLNALSYGSPIFKANGVFFLEPSFFSQFVALTLLIELSGRNQIHRLVILLAGMACAFSGTGLLVLGAGLAALTLAHRRWDVVALVSIVCLLVIFFGDAFGLTLFLERSSEFTNTNSSGFERFVAWIYMFQDQFWNGTSTVWTGNGAGSFATQAAVARYSVWESSFAKILFEFGLPGLAFYFAFLFYCVFSSKIPVPVKLGLLVCLFMNGPYSETNAGIFLTLVLWPAGAHRQALQVAQPVRGELAPASA